MVTALWLKVCEGTLTCYSRQSTKENSFRDFVSVSFKGKAFQVYIFTIKSDRIISSHRRQNLVAQNGIDSKKIDESPGVVRNYVEHI